MSDNSPTDTLMDNTVTKPDNKQNTSYNSDEDSSTDEGSIPTSGGKNKKSKRRKTKKTKRRKTKKTKRRKTKRRKTKRRKY